VAKEARDATTKGYGTGTNEESREDGGSNDMPSVEGRGYTKKPSCYECGQKGEWKLLKL